MMVLLLPLSNQRVNRNKVTLNSFRKILEKPYVHSLDEKDGPNLCLTSNTRENDANRRNVSEEEGQIFFIHRFSSITRLKLETLFKEKKHQIT